MDDLWAIVFLFLIFGGWRLVIWLLSVGGSAAIDTAKGKGSFTENFDLHRHGMQQFEVQVVDGTVGDADLPAWIVGIKGLFPIHKTCNLGVIISVVDISDAEGASPVLAALDEFQEPDTRAFQFAREIGECEPNQGFPRWVEIGCIPKELLIYPYSGHRTLAIIVRLIDMTLGAEVHLGFADRDQPGIITVLAENVQSHAERGFLERSEMELGVAASSIRLALAVAYSDGSLHGSEAAQIQQWARKYIEDVPEGAGRDKVKAFLNDAIRYGNTDAKSGDLSISVQVEMLNSQADKAEKYSAMELCLDVMAADGAAEKEELKMINQLCTALELDSERFNQLRDHRLIQLDSTPIDDDNIWDVLGIDASATNADKRTQLKSLYRKWNSRAESLEDGEEREKAQQMLERIAEARSLLDA